MMFRATLVSRVQISLRKALGRDFIQVFALKVPMSVECGAERASSDAPCLPLSWWWVLVFGCGDSDYVLHLLLLKVSVAFI